MRIKVTDHYFIPMGRGKQFSEHELFWDFDEGNWVVGETPIIELQEQGGYPIKLILALLFFVAGILNSGHYAWIVGGSHIGIHIRSCRRHPAQPCAVTARLTRPKEGCECIK